MSSDIDAIADATAAIAKDCPFCGSQNVTVSTIEHDDEQLVSYSVACEKCDALGPAAPSPNEAADMWDSRV